MSTKTSVSVLDTGVANVASVLYSLERIGCKGGLTSDPDVLKNSSHVILPGVGTATALFARLHALELIECLRGLTQPVLGICLGMQALYAYSEEGEISCLSILNGRVRRLAPVGGQTVPHMGWNQVHRVADSRLLKDLPESSNFYFVHSYGAEVDTAAVAVTDHGGQFAAVVESANWFGTQFHPERSGAMGERLLSNFLKI